MKFVIALAIISTIINIYSYFIQKREVEEIKSNFKQLRNIYKNLRDREDK
jgi:uncharacterized membrane protein (DUF106 family)